jgi:hypothetical protein
VELLQMPRRPAQIGGIAALAVQRVCGQHESAQVDPTAAEAVALLALAGGQNVEPAESSDGTDGR